VFRRQLDSPLRVIQVVPEKHRYDGIKMLQHSLIADESRLGNPKSSDTERLPRELARRGPGSGAAGSGEVPG
jgi:hypothetical protein